MVYISMQKDKNYFHQSKKIVAVQKKHLSLRPLTI